MNHRILCIIIFVLAAFLLLASSTVVYASMGVKVQSPLTKYYANSTYRFLETKFTVYWRPPVPLENIHHTILHTLYQGFTLTEF